MSHLSTYICSFIFIVFHHMIKKEIKKNVHLLSTFSKGSVLTSPRPTSSHALPSNILPPPPTSPSIHCPPPLFFLFQPTVSLVLITASPSRHRGNLHCYFSLHLELMQDVREGQEILSCQEWIVRSLGRGYREEEVQYIIYIRVFTSRMDSAQLNITLSGFRESIVSSDLHAMCT